MILTSALIASVERKAAQQVASSAADLGTITTGVAVRSGDPTSRRCRRAAAALRAAGGIFFPDPKLATAGIHFAKVLERLGIADEGRLRAAHRTARPPWRHSPRSRAAAPIGCTQVTEILNTKG